MGESVIETIAKMAIKALTPKLREMLTEELNKLEAKADETKTPVDDITVALIKAVINVE